MLTPGQDTRILTNGGGVEHAATGTSRDIGRSQDDSSSPLVAPDTEPGEGADKPTGSSSEGPTLNAARQHQGLRIVSANVQKCRENTHVLLERYRDADIICVQEPCWSFTKNVVLTVEKNGQPTFGTAHHRNFITLGDSEHARVVVYVHRQRWAKASPRIRSTCVNHDDVLCVSMNIGERELTFINIYNDSRTFAGLEALLLRANDIPPLSFMVGDFNIRHPMWDKNERRFDQQGSRIHLRHTTKADQLIELATEHLGLALANEPEGPATWYSNNLGVREGVLDLLWADADLPSIPRLHVNDLDRHNSDHAILEWTLPIDPNIQREASIPRDSERAAQFVHVCKQNLDKAYPRTTQDIKTRQDLTDTATAIEGALQQAWQQFAEVPKTTKRSKTWWNEECRNLAGTLRNLRKEQKTQRHLRTEIRRRLRQQGERHITYRGELHQDTARATERLQHLNNLIKQTSKRLRGAIRRAKTAFFNRRIETTESARIWDLVGWTKPRSADTNNCIVKSDGTPTKNQEELGEVFQAQFTPANPQPVDISILDDIEQRPAREFKAISATEVKDALAGTGNFSAPGPDHVSWYWLKRILSDQQEGNQRQDNQQGSQDLMTRTAIFFTACVRIGVMPEMFKVSRTVVIPKPNKPDYTKAKAYRPIVLLNCLGKLLEKVIARRLQFEAQKFGILHPCQFGGAMQHSTVDAGMQLVHNIKQAWRQGLDSSAILLDIAQFFPSINHELLAGILRRQGFDPQLCNFFQDYLVGRKTQFQFNGAIMDPMDFSTGVGQGSSLSPILTGLFLAPILHKIAPTKQNITLVTPEGTHLIRHDWSPHQMQANGNATLQFFVDDGLIHVAGKLDRGAEPGDQLKYNAVLLRNIYNKLANYLGRAGLRIEADKLELMHFVHRQRKRTATEDGLGPAVKIRHEGATRIIKPTKIMRYLGFFLDPTLSFKEHVRYYATKGCSSVNALRMLGNSKHGLAPSHRRTLYLTNVLPVLTYGAQLWWSPNWKGTKGLAKRLQQAQSRAARWITGAFHTTPIGAMETKAGLLPIRHQIDKLATRGGLRALTLHNGHPTRAIMGHTWRPNTHNISAPFPLPEKRTVRTHIDTPLSHIRDNVRKRCQEEFDATSDECRPGSRIIDEFEDRIVTHLTAPAKGTDSYYAWLRNEFKPRLARAMGNQGARVLFTDGSALIPQGPANLPRTGAAYIISTIAENGKKEQTSGSIGCGNVTPFDAEMIALARGVSKACQNIPQHIKELHIYTDNRAALQRTLDPKLGPSQMCAILAAKCLREFLCSDNERVVHFHWCPAHQGITLNEAVDVLAKEGAEGPQPPYTSMAKAKQIVTEQAVQRWLTQTKNRAYMGQQTLLEHEEGMITHTNKNWFIQRMGHRPRELARNVRFSSGHFPCGTFRERFKLPGPTKCWWCINKQDSRDHALQYCPGWSRELQVSEPPGLELRHAPGGRWQDFDSRKARDTADRVSPPQKTDPASVRKFLQLNPMLGTFAWGEIVTKAEEDWNKGLTEATSSNIFRANAHSGWRQAERVRWLAHQEERTRAFGSPEVSQAQKEQSFTKWYGHRMVSHMCRVFGCEDQRQALLEEFGVRKVTPGSRNNTAGQPKAKAPTSDERTYAKAKRQPSRRRLNEDRAGDAAVV